MPGAGVSSPEACLLLPVSGSVTGVGLEITYDGAAGSDVVVLTPTPGGPADKAGVKAGDVIMSVDGNPTKGLSLYDVSDLLQGEADSQVGWDGCQGGCGRLRLCGVQACRRLRHECSSAALAHSLSSMLLTVGQVEVVLHPAGAPSNSRSLSLTRQKVAINPVSHTTCTRLPTAALPSGVMRLHSPARQQWRMQCCVGHEALHSPCAGPLPRTLAQLVSQVGQTLSAPCDCLPTHAYRCPSLCQVGLCAAGNLQQQHHGSSTGSAVRPAEAGRGRAGA